MERRPTGGVVVVDADDGGVVVRTDDAHHRASDQKQALELMVFGLEPDGDEAVEPLAGEEVLEDAPAAG
jgi:hypothetical protein